MPKLKKDRHKHDPAPEKLMGPPKPRQRNTICQTLRQIYHESDNEKVKYDTRVAMSMAKAMVKKLKKYKGIIEQIDDEYWEELERGYDD